MPSNTYVALDLKGLPELYVALITPINSFDAHVNAAHINMLVLIVEDLSGVNGFTTRHEGSDFSVWSGPSQCVNGQDFLFLFLASFDPILSNTSRKTWPHPIDCWVTETPRMSRMAMPNNINIAQAGATAADVWK